MRARAITETVIEILGVASIVAGAALIYLPAAFIIAGIFALTLPYLAGDS